MSQLLVTFRTPRSQAPFLDRSYPASMVLQACPPPQTTRPVPRGRPVGSRDHPSLGLPVLPVVSSFTHAVAITPVGPRGVCHSVLPPTWSGGTPPHDDGLPRYSGGSAPTLPVSRPAQRLLALRPARSLTPQGSLFLKCFSPIRYLLEPPQVLPAGATSCRVGFAPTGNNTPFTAH